ncbi:MAG: hypothetical protein ACLVI9_00785 [Anaerostipes hadrus]
MWKEKSHGDDWKSKEKTKAIFTAQQNLPYEVKSKGELKQRVYTELDRRE